MGNTGYTINGTDALAYFDHAYVVPVSFTSYTCNFKSNAPGFNGNDLAQYLQPLYDNPFYSETKLTDSNPAASGYQIVTYLLTFQDLNATYAPFNSVYCTSSTYLITNAQMTLNNLTQVKRTNATPSPTASAVYGNYAVTYPPYTYLWELIGSWMGTSYPISANTVIETPNAAYTRFNQWNDGSGFKRQFARCTVTDSRGKKGYSKAVQLNFLA